MEYYQLVNQRESIRDYNPDLKVDKKVLEKILEAGRMAPSACNNQPWTFIIVESEQKLEQIRACYPREWFRDAPQVLIVVGNKDQAWIRKSDGYNSIETDLAIALSFMILAAENEGVATCWMEAYDPVLLSKSLALRENQYVFGITPLGYPKQGFIKKGNKSRKPLNEIVRYI